MKEHAGGVCRPVGARSMPVEWHEDGAVPVPMVEFPFASLDEKNLAGRVREALAAGPEALEDFFNGFVNERLEAERAEIVRAVLGVVIRNEKPDLALYELAFACGFLETASLTMPALAKRYGITKQAVEQGVEKFRKQFGLRQTRTMRGEKERARMRSHNYRKPRHE